MKGGRLAASRAGKLRPIRGFWRKAGLTSLNILSLGAYHSRLKRVKLFTYLALTLELRNPLDKQQLIPFLVRKERILQQLIPHMGIKQELLQAYLDLFLRNSQLQLYIIEKMKRAVWQGRRPTCIQNADLGLQKGLIPQLAVQGGSGTYFMKNTERETIGLFKPFDEEIGAPNNPVGPSHQGALGQRRTRMGVRVGEGAHHEVASYVIDIFFGFGIVPPTYYATFTHPIFHQTGEDPLSTLRTKKTKYGSYQEYIAGLTSLDRVSEQEMLNVPLEEYQLLIVLDLIIGNLDRNPGNILIGDGELVAIDHALAFPDNIKDPLSTWYWAIDFLAYKPLIPSLVKLVKNFPFERIAWKLRKHCGIEPKALQRMRERVALFSAGVAVDLAPLQLSELLQEEYLRPLIDQDQTLPQCAKEMVENYRSQLQQER